MKRLVLCSVLVAASLAACSEDTQPSAKATTTGGQGGSGGSLALDPWDKPVCPDPNPMLGGVPAARADSAAALSEDGTTMVLFGGDIANVVCPNIPPKDHVADTWLLDVACGGWTELPIAGPSARSRHAMVSDPARDRALAFGGRWRPDPTGGNYTLYNDVWAFDFASQTWSALPTTGTPPAPRYNAALVVDGDQLVVFGGGTATSAVSFDPVADVFVLDLTTNTWSQPAVQGTPPAPRLFHSAAYDPVGRRMFTGYGSDNSAFTTTMFFRDLWVLELSTFAWHELQVSQPAEVPYGRIKGGMAFRPSSDGVEPDRLLSFAGHDDAAGGSALGNRNDVIFLDLPVGVPTPELGALSFQVLRAGDTFNAPANDTCDFPADFVLYDSESPERRSAFAFAPLASGDAFVIFGGDSDCDRLNDTWWWNTRDAIWETVRESLPGLTCPRTNGGDVAACAGMCG